MNTKMLSIIIALSLLLSLSSCRAGKYGEDFVNVKWTSEDPEIEFSILEGRDCGFGVITVNEQRIDIFCQWFLNKRLVFFRVDEYPDDFDFYNDEMGGNGVMSFSYVIEDNSAILKIQTDELFNCKYSTIVITCEQLG